MQQDVCRSSLGHRLLCGLDEYFSSNQRVPTNFFQSLVKGSSLEPSFNRNTSIADIFTFFKRGGNQLNIAGTKKYDEEMRCFRFCLKVLEVFGRVKIENDKVIKLEDFWECYGKVAVQAFKQFKEAYSALPLSSESILYPLVNRFRETTNWELRANILKGFKIVAFEIPDHDSVFWNYCEFFLGHYEAACLCYLGDSDLPKSVQRGALLIVDLWRTIATKYSSDEFIKEKIIEVTLRLLNLIDIARLDPDPAIGKLNEILMSLKLPTVERLSTQEPQRNKTTQMQLAKVGHKLLGYRDSFKNTAVMKTLDILLPYLYGYEGTRDRRLPEKKFSTANVQLTDNRKFEAQINNICGRTKCAFDITVKGMILKQNYKPVGKLYEDRLVTIPIVEIKQKSSNKFVSVDRLNLIVPYNIEGKKANLTATCRVLRANKIQNSSRLVVWLPPQENTNLPLDWQKYVNGLKKN